MSLLIKGSAVNNPVQVEHKMSATMIKKKTKSFLWYIQENTVFCFRPFSRRNRSDDLQDEQIIVSTQVPAAPSYPKCFSITVHSSTDYGVPIPNQELT